jgi:hypothetical protein
MNAEKGKLAFYIVMPVLIVYLYGLFFKNINQIASLFNIDGIGDILTSLFYFLIGIIYYYCSTIKINGYKLIYKLVTIIYVALFIYILLTYSGFKLLGDKYLLFIKDNFAIYSLWSGCAFMNLMKSK